MVDQAQEEKYNLSLLRGWKRNQLKLLKQFAIKPLVTQAMISGASGIRGGTHALGGKITPLTRAGLIQKAGRDERGNLLWQLNEKKVERKTLLDVLKEIEI